MKGATRTPPARAGPWLAIVVFLWAIVPAGPAWARRVKATNAVSASLSGAVSVLSRVTDDLTGNLAEFERDYVLPGRLTLPRLDLFYDAVGPATVDLELRSAMEDDRSGRFTYRDLRAYVAELSFSESFFHDRPASTLSHRRTYAGDFHLTRFGEHPIHLYWGATSFQGDGAYLSRNHDVQEMGVRGDLRTDFGRLDFDVPAYHFVDHAEPRNEVSATSFRLGLNRAYRDYYWSASYAAQIGRLPYFGESYAFHDVQAAGMAANVFGFDDLNARVQFQYRSRPEEVTRNLHFKDYFLGNATVTLIPLERSSVEVGVARRTVNMRRLNPFGMALMTTGRVPTIAQIEEVRGYESNKPLEVESYLKLHFDKWKRLSGHYRYAHVDINQVPPTDVGIAGSTILVPHLMNSHEYKLSFTPGRHFGITGMRTADERRNDNRSMSTRSEYTDVYAYLVTFEHFTTGVGVSTWDHFTNQPIVSDLLEGVKSLLVDLNWDLGNGFGIFTNLRKMRYDGSRVAIERINEVGVRFSEGSRSGFDGRVSYAWNELDDSTVPANDYRQRSFNVSATAKF